MPNNTFEIIVQNLTEQVENAKTEKLSELAIITGLDLAEDFVAIDLSGEDLSSDNLNRINLSDANLSDANLSNTNLSNANLSNANLSNANLSNANLSNANLINANLIRANLLGVNLRNAKLANARFGDNSGISEDMRISLKQQGAIFIDEIIKLFSEFFSLINSRDLIKVVHLVDGYLRRNIKHLVRLDKKIFLQHLNIHHSVKSNQKILEELWALSFLRYGRGEVKDINLENAQKHLSAYLQFPCLWASSDTWKIFKFLRERYTQDDHFQIAVQAVSQPFDLLKSFDNSRGSMWSFTRTKLKRIIAEELNKNEEAQVSKQSDWRLLFRIVSKKRLIKALKNRGFDELKVKQYLLTWLCFKEIYAPTLKDGRLASPTSNEIQQIAERYNQRSFELSDAQETINVKIVQQRLEDNIQAIQADISIKNIHYQNNNNRESLEKTSEDWLDNIVYNIGNLSFNYVDYLAQNEQYQFVDSALLEAFDQLPDNGKKLLKLWKFGLDLKQTEVAEIFEVPQYKISRWWQRDRRNLLKNFAQWTRDNPETLGVQLNNNEIERLKDSIEPWLEKHCKSELYQLLEEIIHSLDSEDKGLLKCFYTYKQDKQEIAKSFQLPLNEIENKFSSLKELLINLFFNTVSLHLNIPREFLEKGYSGIKAFMEQALQNNSILN